MGRTVPTQTPLMLTRLGTRLARFLSRQEARLTLWQKGAILSGFCLIMSGIYLSHLYNGLFGHNTSPPTHWQLPRMATPVEPHLSDTLLLSPHHGRRRPVVADSIASHDSIIP